MSETITSTETRPVAANALLHLIAGLLAPMFLAVAGGDVEIARLAAIETINDYRARNGADLLAIAQIIAFGLAALASLSLSMGDDIAIPMALRLRGNANACNRSAEQNRRARAQCQAAARPEPPPARQPAATPQANARGDYDPAAHDPAGDKPETNLFLSPDAEQFLAATALGRLQDPGQPGVNGSRRDRELWAIAYTAEASEIETGLAGLPPAERQEALARAGVLRNKANQLLTGISAAADARPA